MKSKKKKTALPTEKYEKMMELFKNGLLQLENDKSISEVLRKKRLETFTALFYWGLSLKLDELADTENWYVGILLSVSFLEDAGKRCLKLSFKDKINPNKIDRLTFEEVIMFLYASGKVNEKMYQKLMEVREARNRLAHDSLNAMSLLLQTGLSSEKEAQHARAIIKKAADCLRAIVPHAK